MQFKLTKLSGMLVCYAKCSFIDGLLIGLGTITAFCRHDGSYKTPAQPVWTDWNLELLKSMAVTMEPTEDSYRQVYDGAVDDLQTRTNQELRNLLLQISGKVTASFKTTTADNKKDLEGFGVFTQTFPRRQRDLDHSILVVTEEFYYTLEWVFKLSSLNR